MSKQRFTEYFILAAPVTDSADFAPYDNEPVDLSLYRDIDRFLDEHCHTGIDSANSFDEYNDLDVLEMSFLSDGRADDLIGLAKALSEKYSDFMFAVVGNPLSALYGDGYKDVPWKKYIYHGTVKDGEITAKDDWGNLMLDFTFNDGFAAFGLQRPVYTDDEDF